MSRRVTYTGKHMFANIAKFIAVGNVGYVFGLTKNISATTVEDNAHYRLVLDTI